MAGASISTISDILRDYFLPPAVQDLNRQIVWKAWWDVRAKPGGWEGHYAAQIKEEMADGLYDPLLQQIATMVLEEYDRVAPLKMVGGPAGVVSPNMRVSAPRTGKSGVVRTFLGALTEELAKLRADLKQDLAKSIYMHPDDVRKIVAEAYPSSIGLWTPGAPGSNLSIYGIPVVVDSLVPPGTPVLLDKSYMVQYPVP